MSTTEAERQTTGKISYDLGLSAVIDLDVDTDFAGFDEVNRRAAIRAITRAMQRAGQEFFGSLDANQIILADEDADDEGARRGDLGDMLLRLGLLDKASS